MKSMQTLELWGIEIPCHQGRVLLGSSVIRSIEERREKIDESGSELDFN